ncbi:MAG: hypothetical protein KAU01_01565 [Candidatus Cloacimonetes bacterium]|nr:hypothetical protein [Candidatus Cloacimonadota bacterium]
MINFFRIALIIYIIFLILSCTKPEPTNPYDPDVDISVSNLQYEKLAINKIKLTWQNTITFSTGIIRIDKKVGNENWQESIAELNSDSITWTDNNANINKILEYRICIYIDENQPDFVETGQIDNDIPAPEDLSYTINSLDNITIHWNYSIPGIEGFIIAKKVGDENWDENYAFVSSDELEYTDIDLQSVNIYRYKATAYFNSYYSSNSNEIVYICAQDIIPIANIQDSVSIYAGQQVTIAGIVTIGVGIIDGTSCSVFIQDSSGKGLHLFDYEITSEYYQDFVRGNAIMVTGVVFEYFDITEILNFYYTVLSTGNPDPSPIILDLSQNLTSYEGTFVQATGTIYEVYYGGVGTNLNIEDENTNQLTVRVWDSTGINVDEYVVGYILETKGVGWIYNSSFQILPGYQDHLGEGEY